ncbi:hypothetical protein OHD62_23730 [Mesorhizobium sp. YC-39]|uniref:hypothetical protein n=1 Tax=unclassified Mesorhizobium TaxID=325217 RepID=UPI0021E7469D|nr:MULTISPECIES: hypothetical protein [unclassified Mesorhizobium]MCV3209255.1 hypothetical protein [Mesorhizobium sp. YC-2]MCV3231395.1 hypothetical protein [Mesorhizobium sp. YC-39]
MVEGERRARRRRRTERPGQCRIVVDGRGTRGQHRELQSGGAALDAHLAVEEVENLLAGIGLRIGNRNLHGIERKHCAEGAALPARPGGKPGLGRGKARLAGGGARQHPGKTSGHGISPFLGGIWVLSAQPAVAGGWLLSHQG